MASPPVRRYFSAIGFDRLDGTIQAQLDPDAAASGNLSVYKQRITAGRQRDPGIIGLNGH